ncbi:hypothetical protein VUR80DRAFT_330 [Thermomyces stellatus]
MRPGSRIRHLALRAAPSRRLHDFGARAGLAVTSAMQHICRIRRPPLFSSRWEYHRLENDTMIRLKPRSIFLATLRSTLRSARHVLKLIFLQAKYLMPPEAEAVGVWIV